MIVAQDQFTDLLLIRNKSYKLNVSLFSPDTKNNPKSLLSTFTLKNCDSIILNLSQAHM